MSEREKVMSVLSEGEVRVRVLSLSLLEKNRNVKTRNKVSNTPV